MKNLSKYLLAASSLTMAFLFHSVQDHENKTKLATRWENDRPAVEARVFDNHHNEIDDSFNEGAYKANIDHIENHYVPCLRKGQCKAKSTVWDIK